MIQYIGELDSTTGRMLEAILATEEEHADELSDFMEDLPFSGITDKALTSRR